MKIFILEDEIDIYPRVQIREVLKNHTLTIAKSCVEGQRKYVGPYDLLLLDHDMEGNYEYRPDYPNTGYQFVKWLCSQEATAYALNEHNLTPKPQVMLHSHNPVGRKNMRDLLEAYGFSVDEHRFGPDYVKLLKEQLG